MRNKVLDRLAVRAVFQFLLCCGLLVGVAHAQSEQSQPANDRAAQVAKAIARVKSGEFFLVDLTVIGEARAVEAIPDLEKQFTLRTDRQEAALGALPEVALQGLLEKARIAQVLLLLGDRKDVYWNYLAELAKSVLDNGAPSPVHYDAQGKHIPGPSQEFIAWAQAHGQAPGPAAESAVYIWPGLVGGLGMTGDSRALPLLRRALSSPNPMIQIAASKGLAEMHDEASVPLVISRCTNAPPEVASVIAESLVYFDDPEAQKAVDTYVPKELARALREARAAGEGPLHSRHAIR